MKMGMDRWSTASVEGLGFAIPIASSAYIVNDILRCGEVQGEPVLGISVDRTPAYLPDGRQAAVFTRSISTVPATRPDWRWTTSFTRPTACASRPPTICCAYATATPQARK